MKFLHPVFIKKGQKNGTPDFGHLIGKSKCIFEKLEKNVKKRPFFDLSVPKIA